MSFKKAHERNDFAYKDGDEELGLKDFSKRYLKLLKVYGPRSMRKNSSTGKRLRSDTIKVSNCALVDGLLSFNSQVHSPLLFRCGTITIGN